jgi:hypothetical protein
MLSSLVSLSVFCVATFETLVIHVSGKTQELLANVENQITDVVMRVQARTYKISFFIIYKN